MPITPARGTPASPRGSGVRSRSLLQPCSDWLAGGGGTEGRTAIRRREKKAAVRSLALAASPSSSQIARVAVLAASYIVDPRRGVPDPSQPPQSLSRHPSRPCLSVSKFPQLRAPSPSPALPRTLSLPRTRTQSALHPTLSFCTDATRRSPYTQNAKLEARPGPLALSMRSSSSSRRANMMTSFQTYRPPGFPAHVPVISHLSPRPATRASAFR
ncbi:hypothetical protein EIP86_000519 [Pleurotus ostreatoroseus]|nr:hypothetical protein EIP86_000519 [Pleurotus ostreatoroseus]